MGAVTAATRRDLRARDGGCVSRGVLPGRCWGPLEAGHIVGRGMGGTPQGSQYDEIQWLIVQCRGHNQAIEQDAATAAAAVAAGQHIERRRLALHGRDGGLVTYPDGQQYELLADGTRRRTEDDPWNAGPAEGEGDRQLPQVRGGETEGRGVD